MNRVLPRVPAIAILLAVSGGTARAEDRAVADIQTVKTDLEVPRVTNGEPEAGKLVRQTHPEWSRTDVHHLLYLPGDWKPAGRYPVIVEYPGNGPYRNRYGDVSTGLVDGCRLGYGISAGRRFIWVSLPFVNGSGRKNVRRWWGDPPQHDATQTVRYCRKTVPWVCERFGGDPDRVLLVGFSRGAIACNFIGLHDDEIARLWRAFVPYSHYDGVVETWGYPGADRESARLRLARLGSRPQFILHEETGDRRTSLAATRAYLKSCKVKALLRFRSTGFRNHNSSWALRPSPARAELRRWTTEVLRPRKQKPGTERHGSSLK